MGKVISINTERWTQVYATLDQNDAFCVDVSTKGAVKFTIYPADNKHPLISRSLNSKLSVVLPMSEAMEMFKALGIAFGAENISGKDE